MKKQTIQHFGRLLIVILFFSCTQNKNETEKEIIKVEKDFETAVRIKGLTEAFYEFADEQAVIKRKNDTLIKGKENIRKYYQQIKTGDIILTWAPDYIGISDDATLAYTYGKFVWKSKTNDQQTSVSTGVFHTIWKKQKNGSWKYVWD